MTALYRAVTHPDRPRGPVVIGDDLHLDVARARYQLLHEHSGIAESLERLGAGTLKSLRQLCREFTRRIP